jgi:hypothetical protein
MRYLPLEEAADGLATGVQVRDEVTATSDQRLVGAGRALVKAMRGVCGKNATGPSKEAGKTSATFGRSNGKDILSTTAGQGKGWYLLANAMGQ